MPKSHFQKLEAMYLDANINKAFYETTQIKISKGHAEIRLDITEKYFHALGAMHGSVYFKLLDDAAFFAANSIIEDVFVLTKSFRIDFLRPVSTGRIYAQGQNLKSDANEILAGAELCNEDKKIIARGEGIFMKSRTILSPEIGYI